MRRLIAAGLLLFACESHAAITQTGSCTTVGSTSIYAAGSGTISSITVPGDATLMTIGVSAYHGTNGVTSANGSFDIGGNASVGVGGAASTNWHGVQHYILNPATGTQNLDWQWGGGAGTALDDGTVIISYCFWLGVDTGSPVRDSDGAQSSGATTTTPTLTAQSGDLIIAWGTSFDGASANLTFTWTDATKLQDETAVDYADGSWATASPTGNQTVAASATGRDEGGVAAFVFKAAAGGGSSALPVILQQQSAANDDDYDQSLVASSR